MTGFEASARSAAIRLEALGVGYALVGGFAVSIRREQRFTRDVYQRGRDLVTALGDLLGSR